METTFSKTLQNTEVGIKADRDIRYEDDTTIVIAENCFIIDANNKHDEEAGININLDKTDSVVRI